MKRIVPCIMVLVLMLSLSISAMAADVDFVKSITNKGAPELVGTVDENGRIVIGQIRDKQSNVVSIVYKDQLIITPVGQAETSEDIPEAAKETLLSVYEALCKPGASLAALCPALNDDVAKALGEGNTADNLVVKDLFDISSVTGDIASLLSGGNYLDLTFNISVAKDTYVAAMVYANGKWSPVSIVNNGDGTVTCRIESLGAIAFMVPGAVNGAETGDASQGNLLFWGCAMAASLAAIVVLAVVFRRKKKTE